MTVTETKPTLRPSRDQPRRIRVLHVVEAFGGGVFEQIRNLTARLPGHAVTTAVAYGERAETPADCAAMIAPEVELFPLPWRKRDAVSQLRTARALSRLYARWQPDLIHLHSSFAGVVGGITAPSSIPTVYTPHGYSFTMENHARLSRGVFRGLERFVAGRVSAIGAVSPSEAELAVGIDSSTEVFAIDNGVPELDHPAPRRQALLPERPSVVAMGRLAPQQRPQETAAILRGVADLADVAWIGDGASAADRQPLERAGVAVSGWLPREEAVARLRAADVYVHWAAWDGLPLSVLEAMAVDTVVVGSDIPPLREMLPERQRLSAGSEAVATIRGILGDEASYARCLDAQEAIRGRYSADRMATRWASAYRELLHSPPAGAGGHTPLSGSPSPQPASGGPALPAEGHNGTT